MIDKIIVIGGPTASMKSEIAIKIAKNTPSCIINADSLQIYRNIPILSAQPSQIEQQSFEHKLYGFANDDETYNVAKWLNDVTLEIESCFKRKILPIIVGGTGMYIASLINGLAYIPDIDEEVKNKAKLEMENLGNEEFFANLQKLDPQICLKLSSSDTQRAIRAYEVILQTGKSILEWQAKGNKSKYSTNQFIYLISNLKREILYERCDTRFELMIHNGAIEEIMSLKKANTESPIFRALGAKELWLYINNLTSLEDAIISTKIKTRQFAKRQTTWFKNQLSDVPKIFFDQDTNLADINIILDKK